ncbi:hypothetical protein SeMB42_g04121 [Synchytrium endobioticum]|uniref:Uncharacterized protein n=1 Tax=Synchytrium endobioticum TaxID=286115 RepID=A0A507CKK8_9FUNG|nr:hypothetical protein SeLEV6574_g06718 [Synchytrium endobioticum]TPX45067.1 hypothetical protein SeMB42_g04121 [Synchytrium endobioticum]
MPPHSSKAMSHERWTPLPSLIQAHPAPTPTQRAHSGATDGNGHLSKRSDDAHPHDAYVPSTPIAVAGWTPAADGTHSQMDDDDDSNWYDDLEDIDPINDEREYMRRPEYYGFQYASESDVPEDIIPDSHSMMRNGILQLALFHRLARHLGTASLIVDLESGNLVPKGTAEVLKAGDPLGLRFVEENGHVHVFLSSPHFMKRMAVEVEISQRWLALAPPNDPDMKFLLKLKRSMIMKLIDEHSLLAAPAGTSTGSSESDDVTETWSGEESSVGTSITTRQDGFNAEYQSVPNGIEAASTSYNSHYTRQVSPNPTSARTQRRNEFAPHHAGGDGQPRGIWSPRTPGSDSASSSSASWTAQR